VLFTKDTVTGSLKLTLHPINFNLTMLEILLVSGYHFLMDIGSLLELGSQHTCMFKSLILK